MGRYSVPASPLGDARSVPLDGQDDSGLFPADRIMRYVSGIMEKEVSLVHKFLCKTENGI